MSKLSGIGIEWAGTPAEESRARKKSMRDVDHRGKGGECTTRCMEGYWSQRRI